MTAPRSDLSRLPDSSRIQALTGLQTVAAFWVVAWSFGKIAGTTWSGFREPLRPLIEGGWLGVDLFFVLSGFLLTLNHLADLGPRLRVWATLGFFRDRLAQIWPLYAVVLLGFAAWLVVKHLVGGGSHLHEPIQPRLDVPHVVEQLLLVQVWHRPYTAGASLLPPAWAVSALWLACLAFPVLVLLAWRLRRLPAIVLGAAAIAAVAPFALLTAATGSHDHPWGWLLRIGGCFVSGMLACLCVQRIRPSARARRSAAVVAGAAVAEVLIVLWWALPVGDRGGAAVVLFPALVGALALSDSGPARLLSNRWLVRGGQMSYAIFLVHTCVFEVFWTAMDAVPSLRPDSPLATLLLPLVLVVPVPVAWLLWRFVQEPARHRTACPARAPVPRHAVAERRSRLRAVEHHRPEPAGARLAAHEER